MSHKSRTIYINNVQILPSFIYVDNSLILTEFKGSIVFNSRSRQKVYGLPVDSL